MNFCPRQSWLKLSASCPVGMICRDDLNFANKADLRLGIY